MTKPHNYRIAVIGATGVVGGKMVELALTRLRPLAGNLRVYASGRSAGKMIEVNGKGFPVRELNDDILHDDIDICLMAAGSDVAKEWAPKLAAVGTVVIDNSSFYRYDDDIPLVVPEVNAHALTEESLKRRIIANPNCSTAQLVVVLHALREWGIARVVVSTYQSVSGAGQKGLDTLEFERQSGMWDRKSPFTHSIDANVIPRIDRFMDDGSTREEWKMVQETSKIMGESIPLSATCVRVPVAIGHSESVNVQFREEFDLTGIRFRLQHAAGVVYWDEPENDVYATPRNVAGKDDVYVSRVRLDASVPNGLNLWCVGDNLLKGAALNAVQIAEELIKRDLLGVA